jgi:hypothetical protein
MCMNVPIQLAKFSDILLGPGRRFAMLAERRPGGGSQGNQCQNLNRGAQDA